MRKMNMTPSFGFPSSSHLHHHHHFDKSDASEPNFSFREAQV